MSEAAANDRKAGARLGSTNAWGLPQRNEVFELANDGTITQFLCFGPERKAFLDSFRGDAPSKMTHLKASYDAYTTNNGQVDGERQFMKMVQQAFRAWERLNASSSSSSSEEEEKEEENRNPKDDDGDDDDEEEAVDDDSSDDEFHDAAGYEEVDNANGNVVGGGSVGGGSDPATFGLLKQMADNQAKGLEVMVGMQKNMEKHQQDQRQLTQAVTSYVAHSIGLPTDAFALPAIQEGTELNFSDGEVSSVGMSSPKKLAAKSTSNKSRTPTPKKKPAAKSKTPTPKKKPTKRKTPSPGSTTPLRRSKRYQDKNTEEVLE